MRRMSLGNDWEIVRDMTEFSGTTGEMEVKSGLSLTGFLSLTKTGATIHANLSKSLVETSGQPGRYAAGIAASDITAQLTAILGTNQKVTIYERVTGAAYQDYEPIELWATRQAGA